VSREEEIKQQLTKKFGFLDGKIIIPRPRRVSVELAYADFPEVFSYAVKELNCPHLCAITGLDEQGAIGLIYHLAQDSGVLLNLKTGVPKSNPVLKSVIEYFPGAEIYERELADLLGVAVKGLPEGFRYPLTDDWPVDQFPLRKDWKQELS
jgi:NADH-quinone oxidoreductase subunit C